MEPRSLIINTRVGSMLYYTRQSDAAAAQLGRPSTSIRPTSSRTPNSRTSTPRRTGPSTRCARRCSGAHVRNAVRGLGLGYALGASGHTPKRCACGMRCSRVRASGTSTRVARPRLHRPRGHGSRRGLARAGRRGSRLVRRVARSGTDGIACAMTGASAGSSNTFALLHDKDEFSVGERPTGECPTGMTAEHRRSP
jgi:hypothetical protein